MRSEIIVEFSGTDFEGVCISQGSDRIRAEVGEMELLIDDLKRHMLTHTKEMNNMTEVIYEDGRLTIIQSGAKISFRPCDLEYGRRQELIAAVMDIAVHQEAGEVGFLRDQPVEVRKTTIEEIMGVSLPSTKYLMKRYLPAIGAGVLYHVANWYTSLSMLG